MITVKQKAMLKAGVMPWKATDEQLLSFGYTREEIVAGEHLPTIGGGVGNSSQLITDMTTAIATTLSATAVANMNAANGPIMDLTGNMKEVLLKFQEAAELLTYMLGGTMINPPTGGLTAPTGGPITSAADGTLYNLLVGIFQILK
jgi:hypothetical protein